MQSNTIMRDKIAETLELRTSPNTELVSTEEAASILSLSPNHFSDAKNRRWPDVLRPALKEGRAFFYRRCDVEDFHDHMQKVKPKKNYPHKKAEEVEESNGTIASMIRAKVKIEKDILVLQESHQYLCKAINHMRK